MNPTQPGSPVQPAPTTQSPAGVASVAPIPAPTMPNLPAAPALSNPPAPLQNPTYNPSANMATIADYYKIPRETAQNVAQTQATGAQAGQQYEAGKYERGVQISNLQDQLDPSKYKVTNNPQSQYGINITNSLGQQVDLGTYINLTGQNPADVLKSSEDPQAQKFVTAYNNFENLMKTKIAADHGDEQATIQLGDWYKANPGLQNMTLQQISNSFMGQYGQFFGQPQQGQQPQQGVNNTFSSANTVLGSSPYYQMSQYNLGQANPITTQLLGQQGAGTMGSLANIKSYLEQQQQSGG